MKEKEENAHNFFESGMAKFGKDKIKQAIEDLEKAVELEPNNLQYRYGLGGAYQNAKQFEKAVEIFKEGLRLQKKNSGGEIIFKFALGRALLGLFQIERKKEICLKAIKPLKEVTNFVLKVGIEKIQTDPQFSGLREIILQAFHWLGIGYYLLNKWELAIKNFNQSLRIQPDSPGTQLMLGDCQVQKGSFGEGVRLIDAVLEKLKGEDLIQGYLSSAEAHLKLNQYTEAKERAERGLDLAKEIPGSGALIYSLFDVLGQISEKKKEFPRAIEYYEEELKRVAVGLEEIEADQEIDISRIIQRLEKLESLPLGDADNLSQPLSRLGVIFLSQKNFDLAEKMLNLALKFEREPSSKSIQYLILGNVNAAQGKIKESVLNWMQAKRIDSEIDIIKGQSPEGLLIIAKELLMIIAESKKTKAQDYQLFEELLETLGRQFGGRSKNFLQEARNYHQMWLGHQIMKKRSVQQKARPLVEENLTKIEIALRRQKIAEIGYRLQRKLEEIEKKLKREKERLKQITQVLTSKKEEKIKVAREAEMTKIVKEALEHLGDDDLTQYIVEILLVVAEGWSKEELRQKFSLSGKPLSCKQALDLALAEESDKFKSIPITARIQIVSAIVDKGLRGDEIDEVLGTVENIPMGTVEEARKIAQKIAEAIRKGKNIDQIIGLIEDN